MGCSIWYFLKLSLCYHVTYLPPVMLGLYMFAHSKLYYVFPGTGNKVGAARGPSGWADFGLDCWLGPKRSNQIWTYKYDLFIF